MKEILVCEKELQELIGEDKKTWTRFYVLMKKIEEEQGFSIAPIEEADIGVDSLVLLDKITSKNKELGAELADKAINKEITREDLRTAYKVVRGDISSSRQKKQDNSKEINKK